MRSFILSGLLVCSICTKAQNLPTIGESEVSRVEKTLAADDMEGRKVFTPGIEKAAVFITDEFKKAGLQPLNGSMDFRQSFTMIDPETTEVNATIDGLPVDNKNLVVLSTATQLTITPADHYRKIFIKSAAEIRPIIFKYIDTKENVLILVDTSLSKNFARLAMLKLPQFENFGNRIFILTATDPQQYSIQIKQKTNRKELTNLVGILPGNSKPEEYVIFSAHYDHLGIGKPDLNGDSVYNGANDDASGTTAVILLADYYHKLHNNQRTLVFAAFTAEEIGEFGSSHFAGQLDPEKIMAMFNIEMIGTESKWGTNSAYITGYDKSDMGAILQKNLGGTQFTFYPDPYPAQNLFLRSDNASLAKLGVPAHTISTSKMDSEKFYHKQGDGVETLDLTNMTEIINAIALSAGSIISGKDTPARIKL
jgi:Zn-dependent M28 family amino/carboxypeptidase